MKVELKLKKRHPANRMRLGRHVITNVFQQFELNEAEQVELKGPCGQAWFQEKKVEYVKSAEDFKGEKKPKRKKEKSESKNEEN